MAKITGSCAAVLAALLSASEARAEEPRLFFSDLTSGPATGLGDGLGEGTIVSVWGTGLGGSQGGSSISACGQPPSHVYEWGNATHHEGHPAELHTYHKMQVIVFSLAASASGSAGITVTVDGLASNTLPFAVRSGTIHHVKTSGTDSAPGSWSSPWRHLDKANAMAKGDILYVGDGVTAVDESGSSGIQIGNDCGGGGGSADSPIAVVAYPGAITLVQGSGTGIRNYCDTFEYWTFAKLTIKSDGMGIAGFNGGRSVANEITDITCADGDSAALGGDQAGETNGGGQKHYGNYIHDFGCSTTSKLEHGTYLSNRSGVRVPANDLGWNLLVNNPPRGGLHVYDEGACGDFSGTFLIHDNVVINQGGWCVDVGSYANGTCLSMPVWIYNNVCVNAGGGPSPQAAMSFYGTATKSSIYVVNNTLYGYQDNDDGCGIMVNPAASGDTAFGGTWTFENNITVDTLGVAYSCSTLAPVLSGKNIWYGHTPAQPPSWDVAWAGATSDPLFTNAAGGDFSVQLGSPAIGAGLDTTAIAPRDLFGVLRSRSPTIGAIEYGEPAVAPAPPTHLQAR